MIWPNSVSHALYTAVCSNSDIIAAGVHVDLHMPFNTDPSRTPWVGIYVDGVDIIPARVNPVLPWVAQYTLRAYVQSTGYDGATSVHHAKDRITSLVLTAVNCGRTLSGTVDMIKSISVQPFQRDLEEEDSVFTDEVTILAEVQA